MEMSEKNKLSIICMSGDFDKGLYKAVLLF